jgi:tetratricopeptide (TPR) repeat protein
MGLFSSRFHRAWFLAVCLAGGLGPACLNAGEEKTPARAILQTALGLQNQGRCEDRVRLLERIKEYRDENLDVPADMVRALSGCEDDAAARSFYLGLMASVARQEIRSVLGVNWRRWQGKIAPETVEGILTERLNREPDGVFWKALDELYESAGWNEKRLAHLQAWIARRPGDDRDEETYADLATLLVEADRSGEAITVLEGALSRGRSASWRLTEQLAALHVLAGQLEKVDELARRFQRTASEEDRPLASLLLARADLVRYRPDDALAHYRELFAAEPVFDQGATEEYLALLYETGKAAEAVKFLEHRWEVLTRAGAQPSRTRAEFMAEALSGAGFSEAALARQEKAAARAPENAATYEKMGQMAAEAGDWAKAEEAYRALTRLDPKRSVSWWLLARVHVQRNDPARALAILEEAYGVMGSRPVDLLLLQGRIHLNGGDAVSAIRVLREAREKNPDSGEADELLSEAYRAFARQPG